MKVNIAQLEGSYQVLLSQYQSGAIDESAFIAEVDKLQFQDDYGRYWMLGAQSGTWHYYDGQAWHQADPREADKLPFMDENGRYWQRGAKSGDWYYYQPETNEWVKPTPGDFSAPEFGQSTPLPSSAQTHNAHTSPGGQFETELFQDDEGRYWSVGAKTGQWYFYDAEGWHPAQEFETRVGKMQPPRTTAAPYTAPSGPQQVTPASYHTHTTSQQPPNPQQPGPQSQPQRYEAPAQPAAPFNPPSHYQQPVTAEQSAKPESPFGAPTPQPQMGQPAAAGVENKTPTPPGSPGTPGTWFYFDGKQWLQYSTGEPPSETPPDPGLIREQKTESVKPKATETPMVAEFVVEDEPPVEVVDVEVITVVEPEPEPQPPVPEPQPVISEPPAQAPPTVPIRAQSGVTTQPSVQGDKLRSTSALSADEVVPRREKSAPNLPVDRDQPMSPDTDDMPARRGSSDPGRPVTPRKRAHSAHEPTIIIPTGAATSPARARAMRPSSRPTTPIPPQQQRRARENTLPMDPVPPASPPPPKTGLTTEPEAGSIQQRQASQPSAAISRQPDVKPTPQNKPQPSLTPAKEETGGLPGQAQPAGKKPQPDTEKSGYTLGDILRAFPSTMWTGIAGVAVLVIFAVIIIAGFMYGSSFFSPSSVGAIQSPTPTLASGPPDTTPTLGPTPTGDAASSGPVATPTQAALVTYSSPDLDITLEYPENWQISEKDIEVIYAPSEAGLSTDSFDDASMRIGTSPENTSIADLLTEMLTLFPADAESLNEGTISIGSQTWTSTQIRFDDEDLGGQGIATIAVTNRDEMGYYLIALAPASEWNTVQPVFQAMINSFRFGAEATPEPTSPATSTAAAKPTRTVTSDTGDEVTTTPTRRATATPEPTDTPDAVATPLVYAVKSGDTLLLIANQFGVDVDLLAEENGLEGDEILQIGQELVIPFTAEELAEYNAGQQSGGTSVASRDDQTPETETDAAEPTAARTSVAAATEAPPQTEEPAGDAAPVSGRVVYPAFNAATGVYDIWIVDLATGEQTPIAGAASQPAFNRDGSLLAYRSWERGTRGIFFRDFIGGRGDIVTRFVEDGLPTWSPDGLTFAFSSRKEGDRVPRIYIGNQQGEEAFAVGFQGEYPSTMPDGRLVVRGCTPSGDCGIFMMGPRGGGEKKISDDPSDTAPAPSPDGGKIAFMSFNRSGNNWEIWTMNADGTNLQRLTENSNADGLPAWSPDGQSIAFVSDRGGVWAGWVMNADGSNQRKLFDMKGSPDGNILYDEFNSRGWLEERISWAP